MKKIITLILILFSINAFAQVETNYKILQINSKWNYKNNVWLPDEIGGIRVDYAFLEDQKRSFQEKIKSVPVVILYKEDRVIKKWQAGISFKLDINEKEIFEAMREDYENVKKENAKNK